MDAQQRAFYHRVWGVWNSIDMPFTLFSVSLGSKHFYFVEIEKRLIFQCGC